MRDEGRTKVAVIVEEQVLQDYIVMLLVGEGYQVKAYSAQTEALKGLERELADLIISEFQSANINGLDICRVLRKNPLFNYIPMLFLIPDTEPLNAARLIYAGADDYIKKSVIQDELFLKVKLNLYRGERQQDINNVTKLPGQPGLLRALQKRAEIKEAYAVHYIEISKFREFNYHYGFEKSDSVLKFSSSIILKALRELGDASDFLCHYQINEFILLSMTDTADGIAEKIISDFDKGVSTFYDEEDKKRGFLLLKSRFGEAQKIPFLTAHIGVATNAYFPLFPPARIMQIAYEVKESTQKIEKSIFIKEERKNYTIL